MAPLLALALSACLAAEASGPLELTIQSAVDLAMKQNRSVRQAEIAVEAAQAAVREALASRRFQLNVQGSVVNQHPSVTLEFPNPMGPPVRFELVPSIVWRFQAQALQPVYHGGALRWAERAAELGVQASVYEAERTRATVARDVRRLFLTVLQAKQLLGVAQENLRRAEKHLADAKARVEAGVAPGFDVIRAEAEVANARDTVVAAQAAYDRALAALKTLLAIPVTEEVKLVEPTLPPQKLADLQEAMAVAVRRRPEVRAADVAVDLAKTQVRLAGASGRPAIDLFATYSKQTSAGMIGHNWNWTFGLQVSMNAFDSGRTKAAVQQAEAKVRQAKELLKQVREAVALDVYQACVGLREAAEKIVAAEKGVRQAEEAMRIADLRYREGVGPAVEVFDARAALIAARANLVNARIGYLQALVDLEYATGAKLEELMSLGGWSWEAAAAPAEGGQGQAGKGKSGGQ